MKKRYSKALKRKRKRKKKYSIIQRCTPILLEDSSVKTYAIVIGKARSIIGEILFGVTFVNDKETGIYERSTHANPMFSLGHLPDEDWANQWKEKLLKESEKCRSQTYIIVGRSFDVSNRDIEQQLRNSLVGWSVKFVTRQQVTADEFAIALKEFQEEWRPFDWENWGK